MPRRFTLAELLLWVTLPALVLAMFVPIWRSIQQTISLGSQIVSVAASADGTTFGALLGDGKVLVWDNRGSLKTTLQTGGSFIGRLVLSPDGRFAAVSTGWQPAGRPVQRVELWDVGTGKLRKSMPVPLLGHFAFSPDGKTFALIDEDSLELESLAEETHLATIAVGGTRVVFSPDGQTIAVATHKGVETYRTASQERVERLDVSDERQPWSCADLAWSPDGQTLAALCMFPQNAQQTIQKTIQTWRGNDRRSLSLAPDEFFDSLTYLPGDRSLALAGASGVTLLDATTLDRSTAKQVDDVLMLAAGQQGDTVLAAGFYNVDLRNATLDPRQSLFGGSPSPQILPATIGLVAWFMWFGVRRARKLRRPCQTCGQPFQPASRKDVNVDCPTCRQKLAGRQLTPAEAGRRQRRTQRQGWLVLLIVDGLLAALTALAVGEQAGFVWPFLITLALLPALLIGFLFVWQRWKLRRAVNPARDVALADAAASTPGTTGQIGEMLVWAAQGSSLVDVLESQAEVARERLATALGCGVPAATARAFFFEDGEIAGRYMRSLGVQVPAGLTQRSFYWRAPARRMVVAERSVREQVCNPQTTLRSLVVYQLLEAIEGRAPAAWIDQGLASSLSHDDEYQELAAVNRRVMAGLAAGRAVPAAEFVAITPNQVWLRHMRYAQLEHFAWSNHFAAQAWSVMEFVCGRGATPDRRQAFRAFFGDADRRKRPAPAIERHFGCSCDELLAKWRAWVDGQGAGEHLPPPPHVANHLLADPIARLDSADALPGERVSAIRQLGEHGYLLGADRLIPLLRQDNLEIAAEAVWALECISGQVLGWSHDAWEKWWKGVNGRFDALPAGNAADLAVEIGAGYDPRPFSKGG